MRALGWPVALAVLAGGALLGAIVALIWSRQKTDGRREVLERLHA